MPSLFSRTREIVHANGHAALDRIENPVIMSAQLLRDLDDEITALRSRLVAAVARLRQLQNSQKLLVGDIQRLHSRAAAAVQNQQETDARRFLAQKLRSQQQADEASQLLQQQQQWIDDLKRERAHLLAEREDLSSQARLLAIKQSVASITPTDTYSRSLSRRERMQAWSNRLEADHGQLLAAQELRAEELGEREPLCDHELDAALAALRHEQENAQ